MSRVLLVMFVALAAGCPPPPVEAHEAAAQLRDNPHRIGTISRQELATDVTDPDSTIGTPSRPAPVASKLSIKIIGMVQTKICFLVEEVDFETGSADQKASYNQKMERAQWAAVAYPKGWLDKPIPWPNPTGGVMVKTHDPMASGAIDAVVCLPAPEMTEKARLLVLAMSWPDAGRQLAMWEITD